MKPLSTLSLGFTCCVFLSAQSPRPDQAPAIESLQGGGLLGWLSHPYEAKRASRLDLNNSPRLYDLIKAGNLYLSLADAIALAIENNLDVEISRLQIPIAASDVMRAEGGGGLRGIGLVTTQLPVGAGGPASPLLNIAATSATPGTAIDSDVANLAELTPGAVSNSILPGAGGSPGDFAAGPNLPVFDPTLTGDLYRTRATTPDAYPGAVPVLTQSTTGSIGLQQGYSLGGTYAVTFNSLSESILAPRNPFTPYSTGSLEVTVTQPLLRGFGREVNRRFIAIGKNDEKITDLSFRQQLINTVFGISRLYYDLAALNEDLRVKQDTLKAANVLYDNTNAGVEEGTMAPVELTRAEAQVSGAEQDLVNSQGLFDEEEVIIKNLLSRRGTQDAALQTARIIPTESLTIPRSEEFPQLNDLFTQATQHRPDLLQAKLQLTNTEIQLKATRNALLPELNVVGIVATNGVTGESVPGAAIAPNLIGGYSNLLGQLFSKKYPTYSIGVNLNLPIRNRIAQGDIVRDVFSRREVEARSQQLINQARLEVEDALVSLRRSRAAYEAAVRTRLLQEKSLDIERARYEAGVDTAFFVIQYQSYLAQARSTEVVAQSNYFKSKAALDRAIGVSLDTNNISIDQAYHGRLR